MMQAAFKPIPAPDAELYYASGIPLHAQPEVLLRQLIEEVDWQQRDITLFGKTLPQPRLIAWHADDGLSYAYSGTRHQGTPWTPLLQRLRQDIEQACGCRFNSVLLNYYRDGADSMGMHADDEPELGPQPVIASLSLGQVRTLRFKHRTRRDLADIRLALASGSVLLAAGDTQHCWKHGIAKTRRPCGPRVNLTFRWVYP